MKTPHYKVFTECTWKWKQWRRGSKKTGDKKSKVPDINPVTTMLDVSVLT